MEPERSNNENDGKSIIGTWRLVSFDAEDQTTGERWPTFAAPSAFSNVVTTRTLVPNQRRRR